MLYLFNDCNEDAARVLVMGEHSLALTQFISYVLFVEVGEHGFLEAPTLLVISWNLFKGVKLLKIVISTWH